MTQVQEIGQITRRFAAKPGGFAALAYGTACYIVFRGTFLYAIGFVSGLIVPKIVDTGTAAPITEALIVNLLLMSLFAVQHSVMARHRFKRWWTRFVPKPIERSTYVLFASLTLILLFRQWRAIPVGGLAHRRSADRHGGDRAILRRLADRADQHVPDQPLRVVRIASGRH